MNHKLHEAMNEISDKHLNEAETYKKPNHKPYWFAAVAALLIVAIGMGAILYWGYTADLVALAFMVPVLVAFQTVICFRAGRWYGRRDRTSK